MANRQYDTDWWYVSSWDNGDDWSQNWHYWNQTNYMLTMQIWDTNNQSYINYDQNEIKRYIQIYSSNTIQDPTST